MKAKKAEVVGWIDGEEVREEQERGRLRKIEDNSRILRRRREN
jgi:hypothetical protein